jgi:hypothetical protein
MANELARLQKWYAAQCADLNDVKGNRAPWQHRYGIRISTSDNPAWNVGIDLAGTALDGANMSRYDVDNGDDDWVRCGVVNNPFSGIGDPSKLVVILNQFFQLRAKS